MRKKSTLLTVSILVVILSVGGLPVLASQDTNSMTCDGGVIEKGDFFQTVQDKCGEPTQKEGQFWRYEFGPSTPAYTVEFDENGKVVRIIEEQWGS
jgi:hypothetical protein